MRTRARTTRLLGLSKPLALALAVIVGFMALYASPAWAATITVNTPNDEDNADGDRSLREAVLAANTDAARDACAAGSVGGADAARELGELPGPSPGGSIARV